VRMLIAGVGNRFMGDDGFGPRAIDVLSSSTLPDWVELRDAGTAGRSLAYDLDEYEAVIFLDAMETGLGPGKLRIGEVEAEGLEDEELREIFRSSSHEGGLADLIIFSRAIGTLPSKVFIVGCEPVSLGNSLELSGEMEETTKEAAREVLALLDSLGGT